VEQPPIATRPLVRPPEAPGQELGCLCEPAARLKRACSDRKRTGVRERPQ
jgi:hypothetical protein